MVETQVVAINAGLLVFAMNSGMVFVQYTPACGVVRLQIQLLYNKRFATDVKSLRYSYFTLCTKLDRAHCSE